MSLAVLFGGGWFVYSKAQEAWVAVRTVEDFINAEGEADVVVDIPKATSLADIADILVQNGVVKTAKAFDREAAANADAKKIQAGQHRLRTGVPAKVALAMLLDVKRIVRNRFQIAEGLRLSEVITALVKSTKVSKANLQSALKDRKALGLPSWLGKSNEGFIFPDTYELPAKPTSTSVLKLATTQFVRVTDDLDFAAKARAIKLGKRQATPYEALIVASIIEREVFRDEDRAKVAAVFYNRLREGMLLQSDATVAYANNITGRIFTTPAERELASPYNTYKYAGLPPGPITAPARKALEAAANPADGDWLYFMPINLDTGETVFSRTNAEHEQARAKLQTWCLANEENRKKCNG
ncbi:MAG: endolytic transglycosylase MltG [Micropruina sp.]|nr:endolytic transglycosylase MltG [Micropruina sp.]